MQQKQTLDLQANNSIAFEENNVTTYTITKRDGSKVTFDPAVLRADLESHLDGLNKDFIDLDIIVGKVTAGMCQGK